METRLVIDAPGVDVRRKPDRSLRRVLAQAHRYRAMVMRGDGKTMRELAAEAGVGGSYSTRAVRLSFLAPDIARAILRDIHPVELSAKKLVNETRIPLAWEEQRTRLGIG